MLVLGRREGQWTEIKHRSGDTLRVRVQRIRSDGCKLIFDDDPHNFVILREELKPKPKACDSP